MSIEINDIFLDPFYAKTLTQYGGNTVPVEALVWQRFVGMYDIDITQPLSAQQKEAFARLLQRYQAWGLSVDALTSTALQPNSPQYQACYTLAASLFPGITVVELKDIWNSFLRAFSFDSRQIEGQDLSALFTNYLKTLYDKLAAYGALPPSQQQPEIPPEQVYQIALWNRFLEVHGYSARDTSTAELQEQFSTFVQRYTNWHMDLQTLQSTNSLPSGEGAEFFLRYLDSFYGDLSVVERTDLWNKFLTMKGLTANPADLSALQSSFADFINSLQAQKGMFEAVTALSPEEIARRNIFGGVMTSLQKMLLASERVVINSATTLKIYSDWQKEYTKQMTQAPNLVAVPKDQLHVSEHTTLRIPQESDPADWDLKFYTFGYGKISLQDVIRWGYGSLEEHPETPVTFGDAKSPMGAYSFSLVPDSVGQPSIKVTFDLYLKDEAHKNEIAYPRDTWGPDQHPEIYTRVTQSVIVPVKDTGSYPLENPSTGLPYTFDDQISRIEEEVRGLFSTLSTIPSTGYNVVTNLRGDPSNATNPYYPLAIESRYLGDLETWIDQATGMMMIDTNELQSRTAQNVVIQQYVNTTRAKREMIQNATQQIQLLLQKGREAINQISSLWTTIMEAMSTIIRSIYKH